MEKDEIFYNVKVGEIHRQLPSYWGYYKTDIFTTSNGLFDFSRYLKKLHESLIDIKEYYYRKFNDENIYSIDEYLGYFYFLISKLNNILLNEQYLKKSKEENGNRPFDKQINFLVTMEKETYKLNSSAFYKEARDILGFKEEVYEKIKPIATKLFMIEKMCSLTTRKFWKEEITEIDKLDLSKPFKIIARVIMPSNWRTSSKSQEVNEYYENKVYSSSSLIDENHKTNLFMYEKWRDSKAAILILKYESEKFLCADFVDSYSEEMINGKTPFINESTSSSVSNIDSVEKENSKHDFYSNAVEIATPKGILNRLWGVSEINMINAEVVGVISPNKQSEEFAQQEADKRNVKLYKLEDLEH